MTLADMAEQPPAEQGVDPAPRPKRRTFTAAYKLATLADYERSTDEGAKGALLRREGLYSSHIVEWRRARDAGMLAPGAPRKSATRTAGELVRLRRKNAQLERELERTRAALDVVGKAHALLGLLSESADGDQRSRR